eukprot:5059876-Pyramimonas_sp.AAC.1
MKTALLLHYTGLYAQHEFSSSARTGMPKSPWRLSRPHPRADLTRKSMEIMTHRIPWASAHRASSASGHSLKP